MPINNNNTIIILIIGRNCNSDPILKKKITIKKAIQRVKQHPNARLKAWHTPKDCRAPFSPEGDCGFEHMENLLLGNKLSGVC